MEPPQGGGGMIPPSSANDRNSMPVLVSAALGEIIEVKVEDRVDGRHNRCGNVWLCLA
jgi:hypothetical protein